MHHRTSRHAHRGYREAMVSGLGWGNGWNHAEHSALHNEIAALIESGAIDPELGRCKAALERLQEHGERYSHQGYDVRSSARSVILLNRDWERLDHREARDEIIALIEGGANDPELRERKVSLEERTNVGQGKSVAGRVDTGGRRFFQAEDGIRDAQ